MKKTIELNVRGNRKPQDQNKEPNLLSVTWQDLNVSLSDGILLNFSKLIRTSNVLQSIVLQLNRSRARKIQWNH